MSEKISEVIAKVQKLRQLSKSNNANEAAAAAAAADAIISKFQLSEADLEVKGERFAEPIEIIKDYLYESGRTMLWTHTLAQTLCKHYGCVYYVADVFDPTKVHAKNPNARRASYKAFTVVGRQSDFQIVKYMFTWLYEEIVRLMKLNAYGQGMNYAQNYALGVVEGIKQQLKAEHQKLEQESVKANTSQAMVLMNNRALEADKFMRANMKLKAGSSSSLRNDSTAFSQGVNAGKNIHLNKGLNSSGDIKKLKQGNYMQIIRVIDDNKEIETQYKLTQNDIRLAIIDYVNNKYGAIASLTDDCKFEVDIKTIPFPYGNQYSEEKIVSVVLIIKS